ncbi:MAG: class I SAM-dependent methyltransferase [Saprospiraceae bacterium]|nr:class I SAM-dependent methyltransferase [Bacteroidia bacterium]NNK89266.1 class I SAM-dependent methyltransferase [Saprospiraceae bacterium]
MSANKERVKKYYNEVSNNYNNIFEKGWLSRERDKERNLLFSLLMPEPGESILDAGCGAGFDSIVLKEKGCNVYGIDFSKNMIKILESLDIKGSVEDLEDFNLNRSFDKIVCSGALEFINNLESVFKNFYSHLKKDGVIVVLIPKKNLVGLVYQLYHLIFHKIKTRLYTKSSLSKIFMTCGFKNVSFYNASFWVYAIQLEKHANND